MALGVYTASMAPGLTWAHDSADGGELAAAAWSLGIPHPPGYPTYVLLAHLLTYLPIGEVATRTNLLSALCAAATAALVAWTLARAGCRWAAAAAAGDALALAPLLWSQATVTEVHTLNGLFAALLAAWALLSGRGRRGRAWALAVGAAWGLSMGNHPTALFCAPLVALALGRSGRRWGWGVAGVMLGLGVYLYLPLRAAAAPPINWGDPRTLGRFWWTVSGAPYRQFVLSLPLAYLPARSLAWIRLLTDQFSPLGLALALWGAAALRVEDRPFLAATGGTIALVSLFALGYNTSDSYLYLIPAVVCLGLWLGVGMDALLSVLFARAHWAAWGMAALLLLLPVAGLLLRFPVFDLSADRTPEEFGAAVLTQAPPRAVVFSRQDAHTFTLWYLQQTQGLRPDVVVVDVDLTEYPWYNEPLSVRLSGDVSALAALAEVDLRQAAMVLGRPACWIGVQYASLQCANP